MTWVFLRPITPLLFRDGRSFDTTNRGESMAWPMPHQLLGALRTRVGGAHGFDWDFSSIDPELAGLIGTPARPGTLGLQGPWYARRERSGKVEVLLPRPADLLAFPDPDDLLRPPTAHAPRRTECALRPATLPAGAQVNPPAGMAERLSPLDFDRATLRATYQQRKCAKQPKPLPASDLPPFLRFDALKTWLEQAGEVVLPRQGGPQHDPAAPDFTDRVRVTLDPVTWTGEDGLLFSTNSLVMPVDPVANDDSFPTTEYGLLVRVTGAELPATKLEGPWRLGGKGGVAEARVVSRGVPLLDELRDDLLAVLSGQRRFRWILVAPARFEQGWRPDWIGPDATGIFPNTRQRVRLEAAAVERPVAYSGWDLQASQSPQHRGAGAPRPTRLFVPAGAVYFFTVLDDHPDAAAIAEAGWMKSLAASPPPPADPAAAIDAACGLGTGLFAPWEPSARTQDGGR